MEFRWKATTSAAISDFRYGAKEVRRALPEERGVHVDTGCKSVRILDAKDALSTPMIPGWSLLISD